MTNNVNMDADQKAVVEREAKRIYDSLSYLLECVKTDSLNKELAEKLPNIN